jgi:hypothetical protein
MPPPALLRHALAAAALLAAFPAQSAPLPAETDYRFEIRRDGAPVGEHRVTLRRAANGVEAAATSQIVVRLLGIPVYRFDYRSTSQWTDGRMTALDSRTDDDGTVTSVSARAEGRTLRVTGPEGIAKAPLGLIPTDHWNPAVIGATEVLNTITGKINRVTMTAQGRDSVPTGGRNRSSTRYAYDGEMRATVWYDDAGHWTGLRFAARDGSTIDYVCQRCGPDPEVAERPQ